MSNAASSANASLDCIDFEGPQVLPHFLTIGGNAYWAEPYLAGHADCVLMSAPLDATTGAVVWDDACEVEERECRGGAAGYAAIVAALVATEGVALMPVTATRSDCAVPVPDGFLEVTKDEFFAALAAQPLDVMPRLNRRESTDWETPDRTRWGWKTPGWASPYGTKEVFAIAVAFAPRKAAAAVRGHSMEGPTS